MQCDAMRCDAVRCSCAPAPRVPLLKHGASVHAGHTHADADADADALSLTHHDRTITLCRVAHALLPTRLSQACQANVKKKINSTCSPTRVLPAGLMEVSLCLPMRDA